MHSHHTHTHTHSGIPARNLALFPLMDNRSCGRRVALKSSMGCGVTEMSDQKQQAAFCNMFNQITVQRVCISQSVCVLTDTHKTSCQVSTLVVSFTCFCKKSYYFQLICANSLKVNGKLLSLNKNHGCNIVELALGC